MTLHDDFRPESPTRTLPPMLERDDVRGNEDRVLDWLRSALNPGELAQVEARLAAGRRDYGPLDLASRRWLHVRREMREELLDALVYLAIGALRYEWRSAGVMRGALVAILRRCGE